MRILGRNDLLVFVINVTVELDYCSFQDILHKFTLSRRTRPYITRNKGTTNKPHLSWDRHQLTTIRDLTSKKEGFSKDGEFSQPYLLSGGRFCVVTMLCVGTFFSMALVRQPFSVERLFMHV